MRKLLSISLLSVSLLTLAACGTKKNAVTYNLTLKTTDATRVEQLKEASGRVVENRVLALGGKLFSKTITPSSDHLKLTAYISDMALEAPLTDGLTTPFSFRIMRQVKEGEEADITVEKFGGYKDTGITEKDLDWLTAATDNTSTPPHGAVSISMTPQGKEALQKVFSENKGKVLGIFVRDHLVSQLTDAGDLKDNIVISGIPNPSIATIFADDVNVGTYVMFTPEKK